MKIFNFLQRRPMAFVLMALSGYGALHASGFKAANENSRGSAVGDTLKIVSDSAITAKPKKTVSMLPATADNKLVLLGMSNSSRSELDNRFLLLSALVRSGDLEKTTHWYLPMQPYGISLLKQYVTTGDTFASVSLKGIYNENVQQLDTLLKELRGMYLKNPELVNRWVIKTCYPTLNDSERGYALALKRYMDKPEIPAAIRYQVESLLANAMFSYYRILDDMDDEDDDVDFNMGYLDANFDYYETFKAFANGFDSLKPQFKSWLPAAEFAEVSDLLDYYKKSINTNQRTSDGLFYFLDSRNELVKEIADLVSSSAPNKVVVIAPTEELILNDKKIGFVSILKGLLDKGVSKNKISRLFTFSGSLEDKVTIQKNPSEDVLFYSRYESLLTNTNLSDDEDGGYFADYFLFDIKSKDAEDSSLIKAKSMIYQEYKKYISSDYELTNSFLAFPAKDGDNSGIATYAVMPGQVDDVAMDTASTNSGWGFGEEEDGDWTSNLDDYESRNYQLNEIPKIRHATAQIEFAYSYMVNSSVSKFANNLTTLLSENGLGTVNTSLGYRGVALNLLSSGEKNNAKTYQFWGLRGGEYQTANKYLTGFHFGYLQGAAYAMDKKRRIYLNVLSYLEGFDTKLSFPTGAVSGSLNSPLAGKTFKTVGTVYGMMLGTTMRLNRLFIHGNIGYGWDLGKGDWTMNKAIVSGITPFKYTGVNYGIQAGYKFGLFKKENNDSESDWAADSAAVTYEAVPVGNRTTKGRKSTKTYRSPQYILKSTVTQVMAPVIQTNAGSSKSQLAANITQWNIEDTAIVSAAAENNLDFNPKGYHYDFDDAELSAQAVKMMSESAKKARIVLAGENHRYVKFNSRSEFRWMKMLYENAGYRNYILELSPARAVFLERYICKGDTIAKKIIQSTASARFMVLFDSLAAWQMSLPESERIKIYGLDVERFADMTVMWLNDIATRREEMLSDKKNNLKGVPASIEVGVRAINHLGSNYYYGGQRDYQESLEDFNSELEKNDTSLNVSSVVKVDTTTVKIEAVPTSRSTINRLDDWRRLDFSRISFNEDPSIVELYKYIDSNKAEFKNWLGPLWPEFSDAFARLHEVYEWERRDEQAQQYQWREETMYRNMVNLLEKYPNSKFFGQFGRCHVGLSKQQQDCGWFEYNSILARLRTRYFKNDSSLMNIGIFYKENEDDVDDISSSDLLHNQKIRDEVTTLYSNTEENTMVYNLDELGDYKSELRKKFNFVVIIGQEQDDNDDDDYSSDSYSEDFENNKDVNMGVYMGYGLGANLGSLYGETMVNYLLTQEAIDLRNPTSNSYNNLFLGYRGKHVSMQYSLGYKLNNRQLFSDGLSSINGNMTLHNLSMYLHNSNVNNQKLFHYGVGVGYTFTKQRLTYQKVAPQLVSVTSPVELVSYRGMPTASVVFGILKDNVGLDIEAGYRVQMTNAIWEYRGSRMPFATSGYADGIATDLLKLPFATINLRLIIEGTQPVYKVKKDESEETDSDY